MLRVNGTHDCSLNFFSFFFPVLSSNNNFGRGFVGREEGLGCPTIVAEDEEYLRCYGAPETFQGGVFSRDAGRGQMCGTPARLGCYADGSRRRPVGIRKGHLFSPLLPGIHGGPGDRVGLWLEDSLSRVTAV